MTTHIENVAEYDFAAHPQKQYILRSVGGGMAFERIVSNIERISVEEYGAPEWESTVIPIRANVLFYRDISKKDQDLDLDKDKDKDKATKPWTKNDRHMISSNYNLADFYTKIYEMQT
jgi:hypothetical protein